MEVNDIKIKKGFLFYNKVKSGIEGLDKLLYDGFVIPEYDKKGLLIVIRGDDNTEKTVLGLQILSSIAANISAPSIDYICNYLGKEHLEDLLLDMHISSALRKLTKMHLGVKNRDGNDITKSFFNTDHVIYKINGTELYNSFPNDQELKRHADKLLCEEALYYSNRTNSIHMRIYHDRVFVTNEKNAVFSRRYNSLNEYLADSEPNTNENILKKVENKIGVKYIKTNIHTTQLSLSAVNDALSAINVEDNHVLGMNLTESRLVQNTAEEMMRLVEHIRKYKVCILTIRNDLDFPMEVADMIIDLEASYDKSQDYLLHHLCINKSRYQTTAIGKHQYKRRDYGIEVYPSLNIYCQNRRYLQRAIVYTHSDVISETYQQYLDRKVDDGSYEDYMNEQALLKKGYLNALSPSAYKNFSFLQVMDRIFINPVDRRANTSTGEQAKSDRIENDFLYGSNGGITAIIGEGNTFKRYITFGSAFSSSYRKEHTLFLLLNKDDKIVRRRLQCPARDDKACADMCGKCYEYMHFMNIVLGNITPAEFLYFLLEQIETTFIDGKKIQRIIVDDLQIVEYCFPLLLRDPLFLPALVDECRNRGIALYILCDRRSNLLNPLRALSDNVVCTERDDKGYLQLYVEHYAGYNSTPSKIFHGTIKKTDTLFTCYEVGSESNRTTHFEFNGANIDESPIYSLTNYWNNGK